MGKFKGGSGVPVLCDVIRAEAKEPATMASVSESSWSPVVDRFVNRLLGGSCDGEGGALIMV